jgi:hypothetical protein
LIKKATKIKAEEKGLKITFVSWQPGKLASGFYYWLKLSRAQTTLAAIRLRRKRADKSNFFNALFLRPG